jgi:hypothetical protein
VQGAGQTPYRRPVSTGASRVALRP